MRKKVDCREMQCKKRNKIKPSVTWAGYKDDGATHIVPIPLGERHGRRSSLDASAVDEDVDFAAHGFKSLLEE